MAFNKKGRFYEKGKCLSEELKGQIVDKILETGGDRFSGYFPGEWIALGDKFGVSGKTAKSVWQKFVHDGTVTPKKRISGNPPKLSTGDLQLIETMKTIKPSTSSKNITEQLQLHGNFPSGISTSTINRPIRTSLSEGKWSWKRMSRNVTHKFTRANVDYCQDFLNYMSNVDPFRLKFFDESGVSLYDCLEGVLYANTLDGASNTLEFLNFFDEATKATQINGNPVLMAGDILVLDNCTTHHNAGGFALGQWLDTMGINIVYLPTYSPELNPVEFAFNKLKIVLKMEEMRLLVEANLHAAVYSALDQITANDMRGFYRETGYIAI
ncbi:uncharacterized protein LOC122958075 [Acropora millepora]|uniref:uncharacterized protein LOC122958075 n=1 Tax=Acropora millepora TaxID=45264 RepID=UPI001CF42BB2|nr:uncharacterized protein LOC122958075 [Acropora millepora]